MVDNPEFPSFSSQKTQDGLNPEPDKVQQQNDTSTAPDSDDHTQQPFFSKPPETGIRPPAAVSAPSPSRISTLRTGKYTGEYSVFSTI